jgi:mannan endo-1,4-beta-mannosidase
MMKFKSLFALIMLLTFVAVDAIIAIEPSNPNATPEARALIDLFYRISGRYTLTGQHNYPDTKDRNSLFAAQYSGKVPAIWSSDMGFAKEGDYDSYLARPNIVKEAIRQHKKGSIITLCWHAVPPTADEPVTFQPRGPVSPDSLASVQGRLPDYQFKELLTPGTRLYNRWVAQVDSIARYLKQLQEAHVPVLWRPYHEMNGDWFWWGGRVGEFSTADLYRQLYDRLVNYHKLNNLVWVWNVDRPSTPIRKFSNFYPGNKYLDILSLDVYGSDFNQAYYDSLMYLSHGKPILFGEVGNPPSTEILKSQPNWASWVIWAGFNRNTPQKEFRALVNDPRILSQNDPAYWEVMAPYRKACGLPALPLKEKYPVNFSGQWILNEEESAFGNNGPGNTPYKILLNQEDDLVRVKKYVIVEWEDDRITNEDLMLDGVPVKSKLFNSLRYTTASWNAESNTINIVSTAKFERGGQTIDMQSKEVWSIEEKGNVLKIVQTSTGFNGQQISLTLFYNKI